MKNIITILVLLGVLAGVVVFVPTIQDYTYGVYLLYAVAALLVIQVLVLLIRISMVLTGAVLLALLLTALYYFYGTV